MRDKSAGMLVAGTGVLLLVIVFSYRFASESGLLKLVEGVSITIIVALILSGFYIASRERLRGRVSDLRAEITGLNNDERIIYALLRKRLPVASISEQTFFPKQKVKRILESMEEKGVLKLGKKGYMLVD